MDANVDAGTASPGLSASDVTLFARLTEADRERITASLGALASFDAEQNRDAVASEYAARMSLSPSSLYRLYYRWRESGISGIVGTRAVARANARADAGLPPEFIEWFRGIHEEHNTDSIPQARRVFISILRGGRKIPGLGTWQDLWRARYEGVQPPAPDGAIYPRNDIESLLPKGYSARNLLNHKSEILEQLAARRGTFSASDMGPHVYTTRVGLKAGQVLMFDDVWHDVKINFMGGGARALRPIELCCLDVLSGHKVAWGMRPRIWNPETKKHEGVREHEFRFLLAHTLCESVGYRPDGTILWLERGTAAIDEKLEEVIHLQSHGAITVKRAPLKDARQLCSIYRSVASGNPRFKAPLESHHNVSHTVLSAVVGQVGRAHELQPEEIIGRDSNNELLLKLAAILPTELAVRLKLPYLQWDEYMECVAAAYNAIAWRTWHKLEGFEEMRFFRTEFRIPPFTDWVPLEILQDLHPEMADAIYPMIDQHPEFARIQPLAPIEVWNREARNLPRLPKCAIPLILGPKNGFIRPAPQDAQMRVASRELGPAAHLYSREYTDELGYPRRLDAGREYLFHINPFSPARELFISTVEGGYLGSTPRLHVPCRVDEEAVLEQIKRKRAEWSRIAERVSGRHLTKMAAEAAAAERNAALVGAAGEAGLIPIRAEAAATAEPEADPAAAATPAAAGADTEDGDAALYELYGSNGGN